MPHLQFMELRGELLRVRRELATLIEVERNLLGVVVRNCDHTATVTTAAFAKSPSKRYLCVYCGESFDAAPDDASVLSVSPERYEEIFTLLALDALEALGVDPAVWDAQGNRVPTLVEP